MLFTNLTDIFNFTSSQINIQEILNQRIYHTTKGWIDIEISQKLRSEIATTATDMLGGKKKTKDNILKKLKRKQNVIQHWTLDRMLLEKRKRKTAFIYYVAGQDEDSEMKDGREYIQKQK